MEKKKIRKNRKKKSRKDKRSWAVPVGAESLKGFLAALAFLGLSLLFVLGHDAMTQGRMLSASEIAVTGNHQLTEDQVLALADIQRGENIFAVNLGVARKQLLCSGWIAEARVGREVPDRLSIQIREYEPLAILDMEEKLILSREGTIIERYKGDEGYSLPLVTGLDYSDLALEGEAPGTAIASVLAAAEAVETSGGALSLEHLERIHVDRAMGVTLYADGVVKSARIGFGRYGEKINRVDRLLVALHRTQADVPLEISEVESDNRIVAGPF